MSRPTAPPAPSLGEVRQLARERAWRALVDRVDGSGPAALEPELAVHYADALWRTGEPARALEACALAEPALRQQGDRWLLLNLINVIGIALFESGRTREAGERFSELLELATEWGSDEYAARACNNLGVLAGIQRRYDLALTSYQRALAAYQRLGYTRGLAQTHYNLGLSYRELGFPDEADAHYARAIGFAERSESEDVVALAESDRGLLCIHRGDPRMGAVLATRAGERFARLSDPVRRAETLRVLAAAARAESRAADALLLYDEALEIARAHHSPWLEAEALRDRGLLLVDLGRTDDARSALAQAAECFSRIGAEAEADRLRAITTQLGS